MFLFTCSVALPEDLFSIIEQARPDGILDIGAHEGYTVTRFADAFPELPIYAFEPFPDAVERLRRQLG